MEENNSSENKKDKNSSFEIMGIKFNGPPWLAVLFIVFALSVLGLGIWKPTIFEFINGKPIVRKTDNSAPKHQPTETLQCNNIRASDTFKSNLGNEKLANQKCLELVPKLPKDYLDSTIAQTKIYNPDVTFYVGENIQDKEIWCNCVEQN